jgi:hypothetical protein
MKKNKTPKIPDLKKFKLDKKKNSNPIFLLIAISLIIALLLPYIKDKETYIDNNI